MNCGKYINIAVFGVSTAMIIGGCEKLSAPSDHMRQPKTGPNLVRVPSATKPTTPLPSPSQPLPLPPSSPIMPPPIVIPPPIISPPQSPPSGSLETTESWHLFGANGINIRSAWVLTKGSKEVTIAVIDGQFLPKNGAFSQGQCDAKYELIDLTGGRLSLGYHGEEVASLISTCENNPLNLIGINRYSTVLWINNIHPPGILLNDLLLWANGDRNICKNSKKISCTFPNTQPADILNVSLGGPGLYPKTARMLYLPLAEQINSQSRMLVASAGNDSKSADLYFPTSATGVISAGSTAENGMAAAHSNWGETVEIMAPGENVPVAYLLGKALDSGTSFAAPIIAGVISLMRSVNPNLNWKTAVYFLQSTAVPMDCHAYCIANRDSKAQAECSKDCCKGNTQTCTPGRVDAGAAVAAAKKAVTEGLPQVALIDADKYWTGIKRELYWTGTKLEKREGRKGSVRIFNVGGGKGKYEITSPDGGLLFAGSQKELEVELAAQGHPGDSLNLDFVTTTLFDEEAVIRIAGPESGVLSSFSDEIVLYVGDDIFSP